MKTVLIASQDAGSANVLIPVIRQMQRQRGLRPVVAACGVATRSMTHLKIRHHSIRSDSPGADRMYRAACRLISHTQPDLLVMGTAWGPSLDKALLGQASQRGIPSLAVVDNWFFFREKFTDPETGNWLIPDVIAVPDHHALESAVAAGVPRKRLAVTGHPHLEGILGQLGNKTQKISAQRLRRQWLGRRKSRGQLLLFISEAFCRDAGPKTPHYRGYTEIDALEGIAQAAEQFGAQEANRIKIVVKLHPSQQRSAFRPGAHASRQRIKVVSQVPTLAALLAADWVVGMASNLLIEAALTDKPVVSFQPTQGRGHPFLGRQIGLIPTASTPEQLAHFLRQPSRQTQELKKRQRSLKPLVSKDAARRIVAMALELAKQ